MNNVADTFEGYSTTSVVKDTDALVHELMRLRIVTISVERFERLKQSEAFLKALEAVGVDNWQGYGDAWNIYKDGE